MNAFASLTWLDATIGFLFRLVAKLAEPFLALDLIASAADYLTHGHLLGGQSNLSTAWILTQGIALEGSGGVALSMSFDARREGDLVKARIQCILACMLLAVGGIMFFVDLVSSASGLSEAAMPTWYIWGMSALRAVVTIGYIAICRTAHHRFSGSDQANNAAQPTTLPATVPSADELRSQIAEIVRTEVQTIAQSLKSEVRTDVQVLVQNVAQSLTAQPAIAQAAETTITELSPALPDAQPAIAQRATSRTQQTDPVMKALSSLDSSDARSRVFAYLQECGTDARPTQEMIMVNCGVAKNTASKYRREFYEEVQQ